jgi:hypothetical protein
LPKPRGVKSQTGRRCSTVSLVQRCVHGRKSPNPVRGSQLLGTHSGRPCRVSGLPRSRRSVGPVYASSATLKPPRHLPVPAHARSQSPAKTRPCVLRAHGRRSRRRLRSEHRLWCRVWLRRAQSDRRIRWSAESEAGQTRSDRHYEALRSLHPAPGCADAGLGPISKRVLFRLLIFRSRSLAWRNGHSQYRSRLSWQLLAHQRAHGFVPNDRAVLGLHVPSVELTGVGDVTEPLVERPRTGDGSLPR